MTSQENAIIILKVKTKYRLASSNHMSEQELKMEAEMVNRAKHSTRDFGKLYDHYFERVFNFILRRTDDEETANDLTSQTFLKALNAIKRYENRSLPFSAWLYRIAFNEVNKYYNKQQRNKVFNLEQDELIHLMEDNYEVKIDDERIEQLKLVLMEMPTEAVEILELRFFEEKNFREIGYILSITESGAKMRLYRALEKVKKKFEIKFKSNG